MNRLVSSWKEEILCFWMLVNKRRDDWRKDDLVDGILILNLIRRADLSNEAAFILSCLSFEVVEMSSWSLPGTSLAVIRFDTLIVINLNIYIDYTSCDCCWWQSSGRSSRMDRRHWVELLYDNVRHNTILFIYTSYLHLY